ncbi:MAG: hypothetical protein RL527_2062 [Planctomycetota bacterium]|jgi:oligoendopeptidase F
MTTPCSTAASAPSTFVPAGLDASSWPQLEPLYRALIERPLKCAGCLERLLLDRSDLDAMVAETEANLYIAMTCDTESEPRRKAFLDFVQDVDPHLKRIGFELDRRIVECPFTKDLDQQRYGVLLRGLRQEVKLFRPENVEIQTECTKLEQQYSQISGAMAVEFDGKKQTLPQMARYLEVTDRSVREASWRAVADRRLQDAEAIDGIYDRLVAQRHRMALNAGFDNYRDFQHQRMHRFDYTPADCERFHAACEQVCVPLMRQLNEERRTALKLDTLRPWDLKVDVLGRSALRPFETADELVDRCSRVFHDMGGGLGPLFDSMRSGECLDLESRQGKQPGGYQYQRQASRKPFIFMNAAGMQRDLVTMVHEAGHAFHSMLCSHDPLLAYRGSPIEFAEVASMSMELLTFPHLGHFYSEQDAGRHRRELLEGLATLLPWIATIDAFQHWAYTHPTHTRADRTAYWLHLNKRFGADVSWTGCERALETAWQRQGHLFQNPFYYIEYGIAQLGALQLWLQARRNAGTALDAYKRALSLGASRPLPELFESAGLRFDFGPETMASLIDEVRGELATIPA